jgi:hypothetical protein
MPQFTNADAQLNAHVAAHNIIHDVKSMYGASGDGVQDDTSYIQAAITAALAGSVVYFPLPSSSYKITQLTLKPGVSMIAARGTKITGGVNSGNMFKSVAADSTAFNDVVIDGFTFDVASLANASIMRLEYATRVTIRNCVFKNVAASGWGLVIGVTTGSDTVVRNSDILIEDCTWDTHGGTLEPLLVMNAQRVTVRKCYWRNLTASGGNCIGIFQKVYGMLVDNCTFDPGTGSGIYYCVSCDNITIRGNQFISGGNGIAGARQSDNGAFGESYQRNLHVDGNLFTNVTTPLGLGAVRGARVTNNMFYANPTLCLFVHDGDTPIAAQPDDIIISGNQFRNNNTSNVTHAYNVPILFQNIGGSQHVEIMGNQFFDDQGTKTQRNCITFTGAFTWDAITIADNRLSPDVASGGVSLNPIDSSVLGSAVKSHDNRTNESMDVASATTTTLPHYSDYFNITGTTTITSVTASWVGRRVTLKFAGILTFTDGSNLKLVGNFVSAANGTISLVCDGTNWYELSRALPG